MSEEATRTLVVHAPDWSVLAAEPGPAAPMAVVPTVGHRNAS